MANDTRTSVEKFLSNDAVFGMRTLFYACTPAETSFERAEDVPAYVDHVSTPSS